VVAPRDEFIPMEPAGDGYFYLRVPHLQPGVRYLYQLDNGNERPDPASRCQPAGVHGPSEVIDSIARADGAPWPAPKLRDYIIYELHTGTFTQEGSFEGIISQLPRLQRLGITAIELMPVAEFPGDRNWGYDGVFPFAAEKSYGGLPGLLRLVRACHDAGIAVVLDVVYNHLGPEGNYLNEFGPYFTEKYRTPWGGAVNFDGRDSDHVRRFFLENALFWVRDCGIDALRLDAVHAIIDRSATPFLQELAEAVHAYGRESGREIYLIAESDLNDSRIVRPIEQGGLGLDAQWSDDFHHALHSLLAGERSGYYADFGSVAELARALQNGWTYGGQYSEFRRRRFGSPTAGLRPEQFVVCSQNHDQIGNRMEGERLEHLVGWEKAKVAAAAVLLSPFTPLLFMGEEYADPAPFQYHVSHSDPELQQAVRQGRKEEFRAFLTGAEPPDPQSERTFLRSKLRTDLSQEGRHARMHAFYAELTRLRRELLPMWPATVSDLEVSVTTSAGLVEFGTGNEQGEYRVVLNFDSRPHQVPDRGASWSKLLDSSDDHWTEPNSGTPRTEPATGTTIRPFACVVLFRLFQ
jgi:maltooligosyltrehalose trehalohydrolase